MAKLRVTIVDEVRNRRLKVDLPDDAAIEKLLPALAKKLGLPPAAYQLTHEATGRALGGDQTLASFGVGEGDALRLATAKKKLPVWAWVGIVLVVAALAFLAAWWVKPMPTPRSTPPLSRVTPMLTSTPRPTATPMPPTNTPVPTATPQPTPTMDADPTVYDNFNNPSNDGSFDQSRWEYGYAPPPNSQVAQQNGILIVTQESEIPGDCTRLAAYRKRFSPLSVPTFFEAKLMLSPDKFDGGVRLDLFAELLGGGFWASGCVIGGYYGTSCGDGPWPKEEGHSYDTGSRPVDLGTWHTFRIEVDPATMTFTYYIDGQMVGSHVPVDAEKLKKARFTLVIGVCDKEITGYIDDVRIGPVQ